MATTDSNKITMTLPQEIRAMVNDWRRDQKDLPNFSEAVRRLIALGIDAQKARHQAMARVSTKKGGIGTTAVEE